MQGLKSDKDLIKLDDLLPSQYGQQLVEGSTLFDILLLAV